MGATELVKRRVWVRCGGRCVICTKYLLLEHLEDGDAVRQIGEVAHVAGESPDGPRGGSEIPVEERNDPSNLILLCPNDHRGADKPRLEDALYTEAYLMALKSRHEAFVEHATSLRDARPTAVLRMVGGVRGAPGNISREEAASTVMAHALRMPAHLADPSGLGGQIDLSQLGDAVDEEYWSAGRMIITRSVDRLLRDVAEEGTGHVSVFAIALLPLLVALGHSIDDTVSVDVYQRHRSSDSWAWRSDADPVEFLVADSPEVAEGTTDAVLIVNASGTVHAEEVPEDLKALPVFMIAPAAGAEPGPDTFENADTLASFDAAVRGFFAGLETTPETKAIRRLHLLAAAPISAAVTIGRRLPRDNAAPDLALYHRTDNTYAYAFDLPTR
jgi:hypothetical protein